MGRGGGGQGLVVTEPNAVNHLAAVSQFHRQVVLRLANQALRHNFNFFAEHGGGKPLAPDLLVQGVHHIGAAVLGKQGAVGQQLALQGGAVQPFGCYLLQCLVKSGQMGLCDGAARCHGMAAKTHQHAGVAFGQKVQRVAHVKPRSGTARSFELVFFAWGLAGGKHKRGAVQFVFQP
jgi:hypothetical protein